MSAKRIATLATRAATGYARSTTLQSPRVLSSARIGARVPLPATPRRTAISTRFLSSERAKSNVYDFDAVRAFSESPSEDRVLIDVREPSEYSPGHIPNAINIPVGSSPDALFMPAHEFQDKFGFEKPNADQELVFYCKAGVRSSAAAQLAQQVGYAKVGEYKGSWMDWQKKGGKAETGDA